MKEDENKEQNPKKKITRTSFAKATQLLKYLVPYRLKFFTGLILLLVSSGTTLVFPRLMGQMVDLGISSAPPDIVSLPGLELDLSNINTIALLLLFIFIFQAVISFFRIYIFEDVTERMLLQLRQETYEHLIKMPMSFFSKERVGELNSRISADISLLQVTFTTTLAEFIRQIVTIVAGVFLVFYFVPGIALLVLATIPVIVVVAVFFGRFIRRLSKKTQSQIAESNVIVEETLSGIISVKAFTNELFEVMRYRKSTQKIRKFAMTGALWRGAFASFIILFLFGAIALVIWKGAILMEQGELEPGTLFSFIIYSVLIGASFGGLADAYGKIQKAIGATENLFDLMDHETEEINIRQKRGMEEVRGKVEFNKVAFSYPSRQEINVLDNLNFSIAPGELVGVVGPSGAGKSTLAALMLRFYDATLGSIKIDDKDIAAYPLWGLRKQMAIVPQEVLLFGGTIKENIAYGKPEATEEEITEAARQANALEFIDRFPEKMETVVGERGIQLSGGQRQRIAISRAMLKDPRILILDEATSSLDSESERLVQEALEKLMAGRTSIVIAHRLSTIRNANKILVLENGVICESGTHNELMTIENGLYRSLSQLQFESV